MTFIKKFRIRHAPNSVPNQARPRQAPAGARATFRILLCKLLTLSLLAFFPATFSVSGAVTTPAAVDTNPLNLDPAVRQAFQRFYILDYDGALSRFEKVQAQNPDNPLAVDFVLDAVLFRELYRLDLLDTTLYAHDGFLSGKHPVARDPAVAERVNSLFNRAIELSDQQLSGRPDDVDALFARAWARSLHAVYIGLIERGFVSALHVALQARSDDEKVLKLDPRYVDAKLIIGVHQYVTGSLPLWHQDPRWRGWYHRI